LVPAKTLTSVDGSIKLAATIIENAHLTMRKQKMEAVSMGVAQAETMARTVIKIISANPIVVRNLPFLHLSVTQGCTKESVATKTLIVSARSAAGGSNVNEDLEHLFCDLKR